MPDDHQIDPARGAAFMLQEHSRIIDAYHDLHVQKNELIKFYLAFASLPVSIVALFLSLLKYLQTIPEVASLFQALETAGIFLSILLVFVGFAVLMVMLTIRGEQYLYIQAINGARAYFKDKGGIEKPYLVLPVSTKEFMFGNEELWGRPFWETMIVNFTTSMLVAFLAFELVRRLLGTQNYHCGFAASVAAFIVSVLVLGLFVRHWIDEKLNRLELKDKAVPGKSTQ